MQNILEHSVAATPQSTDQPLAADKAAALTASAAAAALLAACGGGGGGANVGVGSGSTPRAGFR